MLHTEAGEARIVREVDGRWQPISDPTRRLGKDGKVPSGRLWRATYRFR